MSTMSIGSLNQLGDALESAGWNAEDVTKLKQFKNLNGIKAILNEQAEITYFNHLISCDADPFIPEGWKVEEHKKGGFINFDPTKITLYLSSKQSFGKSVVGNNLRKELKSEPKMNANVLDYLLAHTELIPEEWKGKNVCFWGTIYRSSGDKLYVRYLWWSGSKWDWNYSCLDYGLGSDGPAALAS